MDSNTNVDQANSQQAEYWNGPEGQHWVEHEARYDAMLAPFVDRILDAAAVVAGDRVLDVGCGNGALSRAAAARGAVVTGVDISGPMVERARARAAAEGLDATFLVADAQAHSFTADFDVLVSRFGVMFFGDPVAAFANLAAALRPGGRVAFSCWQDQFSNEWVAVPAMAIIPIVGAPDLPRPGEPGPFAFCDQERVHDILTAAGFSGVSTESLATSLLLGGGLDVDGAVAWLAEGGMGKRFLGDADAATAARALAAAREALEPFETADGIRMGSAAWLVHARR